MKGIRVLHCADFHFAAPFKGLSKRQADQRNRDLEETFDRIICLTKEENVNLLLIAGDLFEQGNIKRSQLEDISRRFIEIPSVQVFISPGDHDPYLEDSPYRLISWPINVHIFGNRIEKLELAQWQTSVYGCGFTTFRRQRSMLANFRAVAKERIALMLLHGAAVFGEEENEVNPITHAEIERSNLDYLALGHRHDYSGLQKTGNTFWAYSGAPEAREFEESEIKGVLVGEVGKGYAALEFQEVGRRKYIVEIIDIDGIETEESLLEQIYHRIGERRQNLYRIVLQGRRQEGLELRLSVLQQRMEADFFFVQVVDNTVLATEVVSAATGFSLPAIFERKLEEKIENEIDEEKKKDWELALKIGFSALKQGRGKE